MKDFFIRNRLFMNLMAAFIIVGVIITSILTIIVHRSIFNILLNKSVEEGEYALKQAYITEFNVLTGIYGDYYSLWMHSSGTEKFKKGAEKFEDHQLKGWLNGQIIRDGYVSSVYLYDHKKKNLYTNAEGITKTNSFYDHGALSMINDVDKNYNQQYKNIDVLYLPRHGRLPNGKPKNYISMIYGSPNENSKYMMVNIDADKLTKDTNPIYQNTQVLAVSSFNNRIISTGDLFSKEYRNNPTFSGYRIEKIDEVPYLALTKKVPDLNLNLVYLKNYASLKDEVDITNRRLTSIFIAAIVLNLLCSIYFAKKIYEPLNRLLKKYNQEEDDAMTEVDYLDKIYTDLELQNKRNELKSILLGTETPTDSFPDITSSGLHQVFHIAVDEREFYKVTPEILSLIQTKEDLVTILNEGEIAGILNDATHAFTSRFNRLLEAFEFPIYIGVAPMKGDISKSYRHANISSKYAQEHELEDILTYETYQKEQAKNSPKHIMVESAISFIEDNFRRADLSTAEISDSIGVSIGYLRSVFKEEIGCTLSEYIMKNRMEASKALLLETDKTAKDIALEVGFYDARYFYTAFKKWTGKTSEEFRQQYKLSEN